MDFLIGIVGKGFVLVAADTAQARSIVMMKEGILAIFFVLTRRYGQNAAIVKGTGNVVFGPRFWPFVCLTHCFSGRHSGIWRVHTEESEIASDEKW